MTTPIRVALIGSSFGGNVHAPGFAKDDAFQLVGVASASIARARDLAGRFSIPYFTDDWSRMLEEVACDLVSIATPVDLHYSMARAALERGRHVLLEKPFALNMAQAKELTALSKAKGVVAVVNHEFRHQPGRAALTRAIHEGRVGRIEHLVMHTRMPGWARDYTRRLTWLTERERGGGMLGALGSHDLDSMLLWGGPVRSIFGKLRRLAATDPAADPPHQAITADDCYTLLLEFESGATGLVETFGGSKVRQERIEAYGSEDCLAAIGGWKFGRLSPAGGIDELEIPADLRLEPTPDVPLLAPFGVKVRMLREAILRGSPATPTFAEALEVQRLLDAARKSDQTGSWIEIDSAAQHPERREKQ